MPTSPVPALQPFTRMTVPDPQTNAAVQDIYNKLSQITAFLNQLTQVTNNK